MKFLSLWFHLVVVFIPAVCLRSSPNTWLSHWVAERASATRARMCSVQNPSSNAPRTTITIAENRKANSEYEWEEKYEAGIVLVGTEVKSCRKNGQVNLSDGVAEIREGELFLINVHISEYDRCSMRGQHAPKRARKLLVRGREILKLEQRVLQRNLELIPIRLYFNEKSFVKVEIGVGKKKSLVDKRDDIMKREGDREVRRVMKSFD